MASGNVDLTFASADGANPAQIRVGEVIAQGGDVYLTAEKGILANSSKSLISGRQIVLKAIDGAIGSEASPLMVDSASDGRAHGGGLSAASKDGIFITEVAGDLILIDNQNLSAQNDLNYGFMAQAGFDQDRLAQLSIGALDPNAKIVLSVPNGSIVDGLLEDDSAMTESRFAEIVARIDIQSIAEQRTDDHLSRIGNAVFLYLGATDYPETEHKNEATETRQKYRDLVPSSLRGFDSIEQAQFASLFGLKSGERTKAEHETLTFIWQSVAEAGLSTIPDGPVDGSERWFERLVSQQVAAANYTDTNGIPRDPNDQDRRAMHTYFVSLFNGLNLGLDADVATLKSAIDSVETELTDEQWRAALNYANQQNHQGKNARGGIATFSGSTTDFKRWIAETGATYQQRLEALTTVFEDYRPYRAGSLSEFGENGSDALAQQSWFKQYAAGQNVPVDQAAEQYLQVAPGVALYERIKDLHLADAHAVTQARQLIEIFEEFGSGQASLDAATGVSWFIDWAEAQESQSLSDARSQFDAVLTWLQQNVGSAQSFDADEDVTELLKDQLGNDAATKIRTLQVAFKDFARSGLTDSWFDLEHQAWFQKYADSSLSTDQQGVDPTASAQAENIKALAFPFTGPESDNKVFQRIGGIELDVLAAIDLSDQFLTLDRFVYGIETFEYQSELAKQVDLVADEFSLDRLRNAVSASVAQRLYPNLQKGGNIPAGISTVLEGINIAGAHVALSAGSDRVTGNIGVILPAQQVWLGDRSELSQAEQARQRDLVRQLQFQDIVDVGYQLYEVDSKTADGAALIRSLQAAENSIEAQSIFDAAVEAGKGLKAVDLQRPIIDYGSLDIDERPGLYLSEENDQVHLRASKYLRLGSTAATAWCMNIIRPVRPLVLKGHPSDRY